MARKTAPRTPNKQLPRSVARALADRKVSADSEALLSDLIEVWGGTRQLAIDIHSEFQGAGKGGMTRQRILEMIQRLIVTNTTHEIGSAPRPADLTDEELDATAESYVKRLLVDATSTAGIETKPGSEPG
jgi:hypothetical protein